MSSRGRRAYAGKRREEGAAANRERVLEAARALFTRRGIDAVTLAELAERAKVSVSTVYAVFKSKEGVLQALMESALFGQRYRAASARLDEVSDPVEQIAMTAAVARAIYESESAELGLMRGASAFSPSLRKMEQRFEATRFAMQEARVKNLYAKGRAKKALPLDKARRLLWMYTGREVYRLLAQEGAWTADEYEEWLAETLVAALVER